MGDAGAHGVSIRRATRADIETLRGFEQGIVAAERPFDPTIRKGRVEYYDLEALLDADDAFVAIAEANGEAVGSGLVRRKASPDFVEPAFHAYIGLVYVDPGHRGAGVSRRLMARLFEWAKTRGLTEIRLEVYPENRPAVRAYEKAGFAPYMLEMRATLNED